MDPTDGSTSDNQKVIEIDSSSDDETAAVSVLPFQGVMDMVKLAPGHSKSKNSPSVKFKKGKVKIGTNGKASTSKKQRGKFVQHLAKAVMLGSNLSGILDEEDVDEKNDNTITDLDDQLYGTIKSDIVGVQYYNGTVSNNEMVNLVREPNNKYDRNAVKVENMEGAQVGHIKRDHAKALASIMDQALAKVEGIIPFGSNNKFRIPVHVHLWGALDKKNVVLTLLKSHGIRVELTQETVKKSSSYMMQGLGGPSGSFNYGHVVSSRKFISPKEMENGLDKIFETLDEGDKATEADPDSAVKTVLYPHQKQALNWMKCKESENTLPPFWEMRGNTFVNTLTRFETRKRPRSVCGGILADDMGLGKTLEMIALILSNFVNGKPLAYPLPGSNRGHYGHTKQGSKKSFYNEKQLVRTSERQKESESPRFVLPPKSIAKSAAVDAASPRLVASSDKSQFGIAFETRLSKKESLHEVPDSVMIMKDDPDFKPCVAEKDLIITGSTRTQRARKRPARFITELEEGPPCKRAHDRKRSKGKGIGKRSKSPTATTPCEQNECTDSTQIQLQTEETILTLKEKNPSEIGTDSPDSVDSMTNNSANSYKKTDEKENIYDCGPLQTTSETYERERIAEEGVCEKAFGVTVIDDLPDTNCVVIDDSDDDLPDISSPSLKCEPIKDTPFDCDKMGRYRTSGPRGTLIICPLSVVSNWVGQFEEHVLETVHIKLLVYYGSSRTKDTEFLKDQDVVITAYSTITADFKKHTSESESPIESPLHKIEWLRVVLDEGHVIRNAAAKQSKAIFALKAQRRWALTGTPIQNSLKDLWSLINFLRVKPFTEKIWWNRTIAKPIARNEEDGLKNVAHLMKNLAMRRTKNQKLNGRLLVELPERKVFLEKITMSDEERGVYDAMYKEGRITISRYFNEGTLLKNYGNVLMILLRLRQICCHPRLIAKALAKLKENNPGAALNDHTQIDSNKSVAPNGSKEISEDERKALMDKLLTVLNSGSDEECSICFESLTTKAVITTCAHAFCRACIEEYKKTTPNPMCPMCRHPLDKELIEVSPDGETMPDPTDDIEMNGEQWASSAKIDALMKALSELRHTNPNEKSVIVSQFTSLLTLIEIPLKMQGFIFTRLDGTMSADDRERAVMEFTDSHPMSPTVFLLSLKAGGVGINLTAASRVFLMDPAWNPAAEEQCFDRCHRLGQTKDVIITKFVIEESIEENMLELQDKKRNLMKKAFEKKPSAEKRRAERVQDIKNLMRL